VEMMWKMTQRETPDDYVISTGETYSVRDMIDLAFGRVGMELTWTGKGVETIATDQDGNVRVRTNPRFFRPAEVDILVGNSEKASRELGWIPKTNFKELIFMMADNDMEIVRTAIKHGVNPPAPLH